MDFGNRFRLTLFTNDPLLAHHADSAGVDNIGPDLERLGKLERQAGLNTWISHHGEWDLPPVYAAIGNARRFVRCNPPHVGQDEEISRLLSLGAEVIMLPFFHSAAEARRFVELVAGRAETMLLVETAAAARQMEEMTRIEGVSEIHLGLNDLHRDLGMRSHFELLCSTFMEELCGVLHAAGAKFGFGGIGRALDTRLPIPADLVYAQYPRLGGGGALVSRVFTDGMDIRDLPGEIDRARQRLAYWAKQPPGVLREARAQLAALVGAAEKASA